MKNAKIMQMSIHAMFVAILVIMTFVPQLGFISLSPAVSLTLLHIPVLFGALLFGWKAGLFYGTLFGLLSLLRAAISPVSFLDVYFINPLVSVLPRALFGLLAGIAFDLARLIRLKVWNKVTIGLASVGLTLVHSLLVLTILGLINGPAIEATEAFISFEIPTFWAFMGIIIVSNGIGEAILAGILVPILAIALTRSPRFQTVINAFRKEPRP